MEPLTVFLEDNLLGLIGTILGIVNLIYSLRGSAFKKQLQVEVANLQWCVLREIERGDFFTCGGVDDGDNDSEFDLDMIFYNMGARAMLISEVTMEVRVKDTNFIILKLQDAKINPNDLIEVMPGLRVRKKFSVKMNNKLFICREIKRFEHYRAQLIVRTSEGKVHKKRVL